MIAGERYGHLVVREVLSGSDAGHPQTGSWCWVRCDCGARVLVLARHLKFRVQNASMYPVSCGCALPPWLRRATMRSAEARSAA